MQNKTARKEEKRPKWSKKLCWKRVLSDPKQIYRGRWKFRLDIEISTVVDFSV